MRAIARLGGLFLLALASSTCQRATPELRAPVVDAAARPAPEPAPPVAEPSHPLELVPAEALGLTTAVVRGHDTGFMIEVSHDGTVARWAEAFLAAFARIESDLEDSDARDGVHEAKRRAVDARRKDVERALGRKSRLAPAPVRSP